ncbi:MAG: pyroglutamyl-peptidase I [bacterium]|nr:pyroglutamyl-peptidase I [bacterium]
MRNTGKTAVLLVTAFEPFDGAATNASLILLEKLKQQDWEGRVVFFGPVPVSFDEAWPMIQKEMAKYPDIEGVLALGQAEGRKNICLERVALNWKNASIPDNTGVQPRNARVIAGAPDALSTTFPWQKIGDSPDWQKSYSAGTYVCNTLMYQLLDWSRRENKIAGFVHVPLLASQNADKHFDAETPRMKDEVAVAALTRIIDFSLETIDTRLSVTPAPAAPRKGRDNPPSV